MIRIDEFSSPSDWDGTLSSEEQVRFLTFGFDIALSVVAKYREKLAIYSPITLSTVLDSKVTTSISFDSLIEE